MANQDFLDVFGANSVDDISLRELVTYLDAQIGAYKSLAAIHNRAGDFKSAAIYAQTAEDVAEAREVAQSLFERYKAVISSLSVVAQQARSRY